MKYLKTNYILHYASVYFFILDLDGKTVMIRSNATSSYYLTNTNYLCDIAEVVNSLTAQYVHNKDLFFPGSIVFQVAFATDYYVVVNPSQSHRLEVKTNDGTDSFKQLASFLLVPPPQGTLVFLLLSKESII